MRQKAWVITLEPTDKSAKPKIIDTISNRKKIAQVEEYLRATYSEMVPENDADLTASITRLSGIVTVLVHAPYILRAELKEID